MDLSNVSSLSKIAIFQKLRFTSLVRARKTCKANDDFVESNRFAISKNPTDDLELVISLNSEKPSHERRVEFSIEVFRGESSTRSVLTDPWKQLSAMAMEEINVENKPTSGDSSGSEVENALTTNVFPLLKKMRPVCSALTVHELSTETILELSKLVQNYKLHLVMSDYLSDFNIRKAIVNSTSNELVLQSRWGEADFCSANIVEEFTRFSSVIIFYFSSSFVVDMIQALCKMPDFGAIDNICMYSPRISLGRPHIKVPNGDLLFHEGAYTRASYSTIRLFEGVSKWIICVENANRNRADVSKSIITFYFIEKDFSILLDEIALLLDLGTPADIVRKDFVNAPDMRSRREIITYYYCISTREGRKRQNTDGADSDDNDFKKRLRLLFD